MQWDWLIRLRMLWSDIDGDNDNNDDDNNEKGDEDEDENEEDDKDNDDDNKGYDHHKDVREACNGVSSWSQKNDTKILTCWCNHSLQRWNA